MKPAARARGAAAALCCGVLAGCNLAPPYAPPQVTSPPAYKEAGVWAPADPGDAGPPGDWWTRFDDPTLDRLEAQAPAANPTLAAALAAYDQARALAREARAAELATVGTDNHFTYNRQSKERLWRGSSQRNVDPDNLLGASFGYEVDLWGRVRNLVAAGRATAQAAGAELADAQLSLQAELADDYLQMRGLDAQDRLLRSTAAAYRRALDLTVARHDGGVASGLDVSRAGDQLAAAEAQIDDIAGRRALLEHAVAALVGQPASSLAITPATAVAQRIPQTPAGAPSRLLQRRPDIAAAERRAYAANRQIGVARAAYYPTVSLTAAGGWENTGGNDLLTTPDSFWSLGPRVALTLFDGGRRRAITAAARAAFSLASADYRATVLAAFQQVEDQLALAQHDAEAANHEAEAVRRSQTTTRLSLIRYREGATNYLEVVTAQTAELQAEQSALQLATRRQEASVGLVRALGGGWTHADLPSLASIAGDYPARAPVGTGRGALTP